MIPVQVKGRLGVDEAVNSASIMMPRHLLTDDDELSLHIFDYFDENYPHEKSNFLTESKVGDKDDKDDASADMKSPDDSEQDVSIVGSPNKEKGRLKNSIEIEFEEEMTCSHAIFRTRNFNPLKKTKEESCYVMSVGSNHDCSLCGEATNSVCTRCNIYACATTKLMCLNKEILTKQVFKTGRRATVETVKTFMTCARLHTLFTKYGMAPVPANLPFLQEAAKEELAGLEFIYSTI